MKTIAALLFLIAVACGAASAAPARGLRLISVKGTSKVKLVYRANSIVVDLDEALAGTNGALAGEAPHQITTVFTIEKGNFIYLVAKVCSASPISEPMAPCGDDHSCAVLWIKTDRALKSPVFQCEIYESCSYNYYDSNYLRDQDGLRITYGGAKKRQLVFELLQPEKGLVVTELKD
ncbi:MAG: hypothetical protein ABIP75_15615 [Pyrinomonadaceae bacterium]